MRLDKPIGWLLLLWPTLLALWGAGRSAPSWVLGSIFTLGVIVMRSAGCVINDWADRRIDGKVLRTAQRPLAHGSVTAEAAIVLFLGLLISAFGLVWATNSITIILSIGAVCLASVYPFMKRYTHYPQVILGMAFAWGIPMAYAARTEQVPIEAGILYLATVLWTVAFDTIYAMVDRQDDLKIGVKSTAIAFGKWDLWMIGILQCGALMSFAVWGKLAGLGTGYALGWWAASGWSVYQQYTIRSRAPAACFRAFLRSHWVGAFLWLGACHDWGVV